jgi:pimeloyl-ACP methyl ester carboxylesterase
MRVFADEFKEENMPFAEISTGACLHYEDLNPDADRIPVVCLHGLLGTGPKDLGHVLDWLAEEGYQVIAPSLRGYGESTPKPRDFPFRFYNRDAEDVLAFLDALEIKRCHLFGYSDGGEVALICAGTEPERFTTVATVGSVGYQGQKVRQVVMGYRPGREWITSEEIEMHNIENPDAFSAQWVRSMVMLVDSGGDVAVSLAPKISSPLLMMLGDKDTLNPREYAERIVQAAKNAQIEMFDSGHGVHDEQTEQFRKVYKAHLQRGE